MCLPFCHKWKVLERNEMSRVSNITNKVVEIWHNVIYQCERCGLMKRQRLDL